MEIEKEKLEEIAEELDIELEQLQSEKVKDCAESVFEENPDLDKSQAFAICQSMENKGQLAQKQTNNRDNKEKQEGNRENKSITQPFRGLQDETTEMDPPGPVARNELEDDSIQYKNILILAPGAWTDAATKEEIYYSEKLTENIAGNPEQKITDTSVNVNHEDRDVLLQVGDIDKESIERDEFGNLYADITLYNDTTASKDAVALMDRALKTEGLQGAGGVSIEIPMGSETIEWDPDRQMNAMVDGELAGLGIITDAASAPAQFENQFQNRAVAMSATGEGKRLLRTPKEDINGGDRILGMDKEELDSRLSDIEDTLKSLVDRDLESENEGEGGGEQNQEETGGGENRELQTFDTAQDLVDSAESEGFDSSESTLQELVEFVDANMDVSEDEMDALEDAIDAYLQTQEGDSPDAVSAEGLRDFLVEQGGAETDEEEGGGEDEREGGSDEDMEEEEDKEMSELREEIRTLEERLEKLEERPEPKKDYSNGRDDSGGDRELFAPNCEVEETSRGWVSK